MLAHIAHGIDFDEFRSATNVRGENIAVSLNAIEKWGERALSKLNPGQFGRSINVVDPKNLEAATWPVHTLLDPQTGRLGFISDNMGFTLGKMLISCLVISRRKQHVWCLGLVPNNNDDGESSKEYM